MLTKFVPILRLANQHARFQAVRCLGDHAPAHFKSDIQNANEQKTHMDFHPVPEGSWQEHHDKRNSKWNMQIAATSVLLAATLVAMYQTDCFYLHSRPSKSE